MQTKTKKIVLAALFGALTSVATMFIQIPSPLKGYLNLGDCVVLLCGWLLSPLYGFLAAGIGSALADLLLSYVTYAPATFIIKGLMAVVAHYCYKMLYKKVKPFLSRIISGILAEVLMVAGYLLFESLLYGFLPSVVNVPANAVQAVAGIILGTILIKIFEKNKFLTR